MPRGNPKSLPLMREVAKPQALTEGETQTPTAKPPCIHPITARSFSPPVRYADSPLVRGGLVHTLRSNPESLPLMRSPRCTVTKKASL